MIHDMLLEFTMFFQDLHIYSNTKRCMLSDVFLKTVNGPLPHLWGLTLGQSTARFSGGVGAG